MIGCFQSGEIARHLDFVGHGIRTQLDEIKRKEVDRLRQIIRLQSAMKKGTDDDDDSLAGVAADDKGIFGMLYFCCFCYSHEYFAILCSCSN